VRSDARDAPEHRRIGVVLALLACAAAALAIRALPAPWVFPADGSIRLGLYDAAYHARRGFYSFVNFPAVLRFDRYIAWPDGAPVPWPPGYDWALASVARLFGSSEETFERVAAWSSPVLGALLVWPVYAIGRHLGGRGVGLGAAALCALLPAASLPSRVGDSDHHALVVLLAAAWLAASLAETREVSRGRRRLLESCHAALVASMLLSWNGSLLYLVLGEGTRLFVASVVAGSAARLRAQARSDVAAALAVAPVVAASGVPSGGWLSSVSLSWLHVIVLGALALLASLLAMLEGWRPAPGALRRALRTTVLAGLVGLGLLAVAPLRDALLHGAAFFDETAVWAAVEQRPLFDQSPTTVKRSANERFGGFAVFVPLTLLLVGVRLRSAPAQSLVVFGVWSSVLALFALHQVRFAHDFAAPGSALFAWTLAGAARRATTRLRAGPWAARALAVSAGAILLWPAVQGVQLRALRAARAEWARRGEPLPRALQGRESLWRFAESVRASTPETSGFADASLRPEYGVLVDANLGHAFVWGARRPVPANNFGPYLEGAKLAETRAFFDARTEGEAVEIARRLATPFVVTADRASLAPGSLLHRLHRLDGSSAPGWDHLGRFRLVTEGPRGGTPLAAFFPRGGPRDVVPYKLFEVVEGALLEVAGAPGDRVAASTEVETPIGRRFRFRAEAVVPASGTARLRLPYANERRHPARTVGPWQVESGERVWRLEVPEEAVRAGATLRLP
jgi:dolichyl-diphosphooligosaccharide--protein glycosyltransferase